MMKWIRDNDVILRIFSLVIAIFLWTYVMSTENPEKAETISNIPVHLEGVSELSRKNLIILSGANSKADIKINGTRNDILNLQEDLSAMVLTASVENITEPGDYKLNYIAEAKGFGGIKIQNKSPKEISITVDRLNYASIPIELELVGKPAADHSISESSVHPDAITVRGPETILRKIHAAKVTYDVSDLRTSIQTNLTYTLVDEEGKPIESSFLSYDTASTTLDLAIKRSNAIPLTVSLTDCPYLNSDMVIPHIEPDSVVLTGNPENMAEINQISLAPIDLMDVLRTGKTKYERLIVLPNGVTADENQLQYTVVTLEFVNCGWKDFTFDTSVCMPDPLFTYPDQNISLRLFGRNEHLKNLSPQLVTLEPIYDLDKIVVGENEISMSVEIDNETIYVNPDVHVTVTVTEEALAAAKAAENQPAEPNGDQNTGAEGDENS